jgi:hypothetical protein
MTSVVLCNDPLPTLAPAANIGWGSIPSSKKPWDRWSWRKGRHFQSSGKRVDQMSWGALTLILFWQAGNQQQDGRVCGQGKHGQRGSNIVVTSSATSTPRYNATTRCAVHSWLYILGVYSCFGLTGYISGVLPVGCGCSKLGACTYT